MDTRKIIIYVRDVFDVSNLHLISIFSNIMEYVLKIPTFPSWARVRVFESVILSVCKLQGYSVNVHTSCGIIPSCV